MWKNVLYGKGYSILVVVLVVTLILALNGYGPQAIACVIGAAGASVRLCWTPAQRR